MGPQNLTLEKNTSTSLLISWSVIQRDYVNGVLRGYVIEYWPIDEVNDTKNTTVAPGKTEVELINLLKFTNYSIRFAGMTYKGIGNWSEVMLRTAEDSELDEIFTLNSGILRNTTFSYLMSVLFFSVL